MLVIADTSPLNYLILIDAVDLLPRLYQRVVLPQAAWEELQHFRAPTSVSQWANSLPSWVEVRQAPTAAYLDPNLDPNLNALGNGEREAIALAELYRRETEVLLLLDEEAARRQAAARQLAATGTLGVLKSAAEQGWIDLAQSFARLRQTNFRVSQQQLQQLLDEQARRNQAARERQDR
jgi:predicted nucleic acid-binding protein